MDMRCVIAQRVGRCWRGVAGVTLAAALAGCTTTRSEPYRTVERPSGGNQAGAADLVMSDPELDTFAGFFDERSDERLAVAGETEWFSNVLWPEPPPPSLAESRRIFLPTRAESVLYFQSDRRGRYMFRFDRYRGYAYPGGPYPGYRRR